MRKSDEPVPKTERSDDDLIDLASLPGYEILKLAKGKYGKRNGEGGGDRSKWFILIAVIKILIAGIYLVMVTIGPMLVDPLFLYVPFINEDIKCLALDKKLKKISIVLRSFTDVFFLLKILSQVRPMWWCYYPASFLVDSLVSPKEDFGFLPESLIHNILAFLPIPQIVILFFLPTTRNSRSLNRMKFLNSLIILQYVARAYPMYRLCKRFNKETREKIEKLPNGSRIWISGVLNLITYILACHVFGAFWYFFSVQREMDCWISTCRSENRCNLITLQCDNTTSRNVTLLHDLCPTNPPNQSVYDFGIFVGTLQSGIVRTTDFPQKLLMCFLWGLRNLSSFASNLNSSTYEWESLFVIFISISGLLLFMYLLGHLQTFMQAISRTSMIRQRRYVIRPRIHFMLSEHGLPREIDYAIWKLVKEALEEDEDLTVDLDNIFSLLPPELQKHLKRHLLLATLKKMPGLENIDRIVLNKILEDLEPVNHADGSYIIREGEPLDRMIFITQGIALAYKTSTTGGGSGGSGSSSTPHLTSCER